MTVMTIRMTMTTMMIEIMMTLLVVMMIGDDEYAQVALKAMMMATRMLTMMMMMPMMIPITMVPLMFWFLGIVTDFENFCWVFGIATLSCFAFCGQGFFWGLLIEDEV